MPPIVAGSFCWVMLVQPGSGTTNNTVTQATATRWPGGVKPVMSSGTFAIDRYDYFCDGTYWNGIISAQAIQ